MNDPKQQNAEAVEALAPETRQITAGGKTYEVKRLETRQVWPVLRCGLPIFEGLTALVGKASSPAADSPLGSSTRPAGQPPEARPLAAFLGEEMATFLEVMAAHGERITEIVAVSLDETVIKAGKFEPQETYLALKAIIEVNRDFFTRVAMPQLGLEPGELARSALAGAVQQATEAMATAGAGTTPSSSS